MYVSKERDKTKFTVLFESAAFPHHFENMPDHRLHGKVAYPLNGLLGLSRLAVIARAETFTEIGRLGQSKIKLLQRFLPSSNGTPMHDHLGDIFATLDAEALQCCFDAWVAEAVRLPFGRHRHRWQDLAPLLPEAERQGANAHNLGFRRAAALGARTDHGE
jgi:hypothetical protein